MARDRSKDCLPCAFSRAGFMKKPAYMDAKFFTGHAGQARGFLQYVTMKLEGMRVEKRNVEIHRIYRRPVYLELLP